MKLPEKEKLQAKFNGNPPVNLSSIRQFEVADSLRLPDDYAGFLQRANGGEGFIGNAYVIFWPVEELLEMNRVYHVAEYAPGLFIFGSDGGGEGFAFDMRNEAKPIVAVLEASRSIDAKYGTQNYA
jgi:hypothetical protein